MLNTARSLLSSIKNGRTIRKWVIGITIVIIASGAIVIYDQKKKLSKAYVAQAMRDTRQNIKSQMQSAEISYLKTKISMLEKQINELQKEGKKTDRAYKYIREL